MSTTAHVPFQEYDDATHKYYLDGEEIVSITQTLTEVGAINSEYFTEESARRGTWVHLLTESMDRPLCDPHSGLAIYPGSFDLTPREGEIEVASRYAAQYAKLRESLHFDIMPEGIERKVFDPLHRYAGRLDRHIKLRAPCVDVAIAEIKSKNDFTVYPWWALQLAAQGHALEPNALFRRLVFMLTPTGYKIHEFPIESYVEDRDTFLSMVRSVRWLRANR